MSTRPDLIAANIAHWTKRDRERLDREASPQWWARDEPTWGLFGMREEDVAGFEIERLIDVYANADSKRHDFYGYVDPEWARKWPAEEIWTARKRRAGTLER